MANSPPPPPSPSLGEKLLTISCSYFVSCIKFFIYIVDTFFKFIAITFRFYPFIVELWYYLALSLLGSLTIMRMKPRDRSFKLTYVDMLYMSTSAVTVSGLNSVDTEIFSEPQTLILTLLMIAGGEVIVSFLTLLLGPPSQNPAASSSNLSLPILRIGSSNRIQATHVIEVAASNPSLPPIPDDDPLPDSNRRPLRLLLYVVGGYILLFHLIGLVFILVYLYVTESATSVLNSKNLSVPTFAVTAVASAFGNCGLLPTNENIAVFKANSGLLLILMVLILGGNTLYPLFLRSVVWVLGRLGGREEYDFVLKGSSDLGYPHIFPAMDTLYQSLTTVAFLVVQVLLFAGMSWTSEVLAGLNSYQKFVGVLFQSVNTRHAGEGAFDLSITAPAVLVLFLVMMYLPSYTSFVPIGSSKSRAKKMGKRKLIKMANISQACYVVIFVIIACIVERERMSKDPLNFNVLSIAFEIMSAFGNVGLSMGYNCDRMITPDVNCKASLYSFSGRWSGRGKLLMIFVMLFGRVKKYHMSGGKAWKLN